MTYDPDMAEYDENFDKAKAPGEVPTGTYQVTVERATFDFVTWSEYPQLSLTCKIIDGDFKGELVFPGGSCDPDFIHYLKGTLVKMGFDPPPKPSEIRGHLNEMLDRVLEVYVGTKKEGKKYAPCYVNRLVRLPGDGALTDDTPPPHTDDDISF